MDSISIIIPVYNEERRIKTTLEALTAEIEKWNREIEIVFSNDGSKDRTLTVVGNAIHSKSIKYQIIDNPINQGKGAAIKNGILAAKNKVIVLFDADNATGIEDYIPLEKWLDDYDIVIGSRYLKSSQITRKQSFLRRILSRFGNWLIKLTLGLSYADTQCGFKVLKLSVAREIAQKMTINRWGFDIELLAIAQKLHYTVKEAPVSWTDRSGSQLKAGRAAWQTLKELIKIRKNLHQNIYD